MTSADEFGAQEILGYGAYLCLRRTDGGDAGKGGAARVVALAEDIARSLSVTSACGKLFFASTEK